MTQLTASIDRVRTALNAMYPREELDMRDVADVLNDAIIGRQLLEGHHCSVANWNNATTEVEYLLIPLGE